MDIVLGLVVGIGLSAACGFRVFVPLLGMSIASLAGHLTLSPGFEWIGTWPAFFAFTTATVMEIGAFYIPWLDNLLDTAATPAAIVAATIITASQLGGTSPFLKWSLAIIAGGGVCAGVQGTTVLLRAASTGTTGGLGNFAVSTLELVSAIGMTILALVVPVIALIVLLIIVYLIVSKVLKLRSRPPKLNHGIQQNG